MHRARIAAPLAIAALLVMALPSAAADGKPAAGQGGSPPAAFLTVAVADGAQLIERWNASIYAKLWADPVLAQTRAQVAGILAEAQRSSGLDPLAMLAATRHLRLTMHGFTAPAPGGERPGTTDGATSMPIIQVSADLGSFASTIVAAIRKADGAETIAVAVPGADEAIAPADGRPLRVARFGTWLVLASGQAPVKPLTAPAAVDDVHARVEIGPLLDAFEPVLPPHQRAGFASMRHSFAAYLAATVEWRSNIVPTGSHERITSTAQEPYLIPVDRAVPARLPATTLMAMAYAIDGRIYHDVMFPRLLAAAAAQRRQLSGHAVTAQDVLAQIDGKIAALGIDATLTGLVTGLRGTLLAAITQGAPFPGVTLAVPRSADLDRVVAFAAARIGAELPAEGGSALIAIPRVPLPITLIADRTHWVVTTDQRIAGSWTAGEAGGWATSRAGAAALAKSGPRACIIASSDTPAVLRTSAGFLAMAPIEDAQMKNAIGAAIARMAKVVGTGHWVTTADAAGTSTDIQGVVGVALGPILAGLMLPVRERVKEQARRITSGKNMSQLYTATIAYSTDHEALPPPLEAMQKEMMLPDAIYRSPGGAGVPMPHYRWVRSNDSGLNSAQPAIVENPACWQGKGCMVCFGDSHVRWFDAPQAQRLWAEANRLAALPKAAGAGIVLADWAAVKDILGQDTVEQDTVDKGALPSDPPKRKLSEH